MAKAAVKGRGVPATAPGRNVAQSSGEVPAHMRKYAGKGMRGIDDRDIEIPRIYVLNGVSPEVVDRDDADSGMIWHNILQKALCDKNGFVVCTPILITKGATLWRPRGDGSGGILARCDGNPMDEDAVWRPSNKEFDVKLGKNGPKVKWNTSSSVAKSGLLEWGSSNPGDEDSQPAATLVYRMLMAFPDQPELGLAAYLAQRSGVKPAKKLMANIRMSGAPSYGLRYKLIPKQEEGDEGPYYVITFEGDGFVEDEAMFEQFRIQSENFERTGVKIKGEEEDDGSGGISSGDGADAGGKRPGKY